MPKKKPIAKRLKNLFEDVKPEQAPAELSPAPRKRASEEKPRQAVEGSPATKARRPVEVVSPVGSQTMSLAFQAGQDSWATLQVIDEAEQRQWSQDEQLLVKQVADQLSLALENARLFQETQARAEELSVLNEMSRELSAQLETSAIADVVYRYTSRLMDTGNFYIALYNEKNQEKTFPLAYEDGQRIEMRPSKLGNRTFSDYVIRNKKIVFAPRDVQIHRQSLGIEFVPIGKDPRPSLSLMAVPLMIGERVLGLISVQSIHKPDVYDEHHRDILATIAGQAAIAIENARLFEEAQRRAQETTVLAEVGREISVTLDLETVLNRIATYARDLFQAETSAVYLPEAQGARWRAISVVGSEAEEIKNDPVNTGEGILGDIGLQKTGRIVNDAFHQPNVVTIKGTSERPYEHLMGVPVLSGDQASGLMAVWRLGAGKEFTPAELEFLHNLARQAAIAIQNASLFKESEMRAEELTALNQLAQSLSSQLNIDQIVDTIYKGITRLVDAKNFYVGFYEASTNEIVFPQTVSESEVEREITRLPMGQGITSYMIQTGESILIADGSEKWTKSKGINTVGVPSKSFLGVPLTRGGKALGAMAVQNFEQYNAYTQHDLQLLTAFAGQVAVALENARLFNEVTTSQSQLSEALQIARLGYFEIDPHAQLIQLTDELYALLGTNAEKENGYQFALDAVLKKFVLEDDIPVVRQTIQDVMDAKHGGDITSEVRYRKADGKVIWVSSAYKVERDPQGLAAKVVGSSQDITERKTNELIQSATTQISESALTSKTIDELLKSVHEAIGILLPARNFYVALYDQNTGYVSFPYHVDESGGDWKPRKLGTGLTSYVIQTGKPLRATPETLAELVSSGQATAVGAKGVDWLGVPLRSKQAVTGMMAIQTYDPKIRITEEHQEILSLIASPVSGAIERFLAEREIQKFKLGIDRSNNPVFVTDLEGTIQYINPAFKKVYGFSSDEVIGKTPRILRSGLTPPEQYKQFWQALLAGETISQEITNKSKDGRFIPISGTYSPILDESGHIMGFLAVHEDITERKLSEEALKRRNDYLAASSEIGRLVTSTLDLNTIFTRTVSLISERFGFYYAGIYIIEETGFNVTLREATGEAGEKMKAQRHSVVVGSNSVIGKVAESIEPILVNDTQFEPLYTPNPYLLDTRSEVAIPLRIGMRIVGVIDIQSVQIQAFSQDDLSVLQSLADQVAVAIDNARSYELSQQLIQELREIDLLKSQFLANMSHELRTPLNSIIGFSRVILKGIDGPVSDMQQQDLTAIYNSGQHLLGLINDILDLARIEAGKMELNFEEVRLAEMATSVMSTAKGLVKEKPIQLVHHLPEDMPTVRGDTMRVRQIFINLISNAAKFTDEGSITIEAHVEKGPSGKLEAVIGVTDTGPGISLEDQKKLFQAFSQVDGSATRKSGGTGLGLSICANLVQLHGGRIGVTSEVSKGSTFWFTLPLFQQPEEQIPEGKKVVLAIDDDPQVISLYERYLNPQGYYVLPLTEPLKAKEQILKIKPFAITLDIMMPSKDGWSVLTELKSDPETRDFPVIICSILEQADKGFSLGAADYLVKPILEEDLVHALDRLNKNGTIHEVLVIDDDPNDLRLMEKILTQHSHYKPILAEGGRKGWEAINTMSPHAIILDLFMPEMDGFNILEKLRESPTLCNIPVLVVSGGGLTNEQKQQLNAFGQRLITKGSLNEGQLIASIENALKQFG
jgi:PAS domain S-box-containing protein